MAEDQKAAEAAQAEPAEAPKPEPEEAKAEEAKPEEAKPELKYTDEDLDRILGKKLAIERDRAEKRIEEERAKLTEAQKLEQMNEKERAAYERKKLEDELAELRLKQSLSEQMAVARQELASLSIALPDELLSVFVSPKAEDTKAAVDAIKELWPKAVNAAVKEELKREAPKAQPSEGQGKSAGALFAEKQNALHVPATQQ